MRKIFVAIVAAGAMGAVWADATVQQYQDQTRFQDHPQASAYLSYSFGGDTHRHNAPAALHYGLRLNHDSRASTSNGAGLPPLLQVDHDNLGETLASANGLAFAGRNLRLNDDSAPAGGGGGGSDSGWSFFDWGLLAVGVGGAGYLISQAVRGKDSPKASPSSSSSSSSGSCVLGICALTSNSHGSSGGDAPADDSEDASWKQNGIGQMGDLSGARP